ncbi:UDP-GalNAc:polypeptide N-acetylgalactosaminyltransferase, putative [Pediculus humanus corporis]|uniref:Polypeptide N-acetylgalactosaminyltransferase n=1 Tax=Pediculus humanus subsp. corporis TaxID=121224 RepID=E0VRR0_PEDHC|nr:UDP-GalNAc:polypeptide N-acetylgalactosaminyltransferase, putative [Pediculus humanus corporis]EEB16066.1 UDP-GalNAc:polypeptide N-acetylgalactosaminyltransferase, putative [Pediculus humanus corporis]
MRILHLKKSRAVRLVAAVFILTPILYLLYTSKSSEEEELPRASHKRYKAKPQLSNSNGNFEPREEEISDGPGEGGRPHKLREDQQNDASQSLADYGMNIACSDEISLDRSIPDTRLPECKRWMYPEDLPKASVIIVFHNEGWSTLLRTVHSVINRTPPQFLEEVLMVDDFSDKENLKELDDYILRFNGKVRLIRNSERQGLIRTRSRGAVEARGEVIVFLDAHCEVNKNWLPPLLAPIYYDRTTLTVPVIDGIDHDTFEYKPVYVDGHHYRGIFEWGMLYKEIELTDQFANADNRKYNSEPYRSPTHAGGLFAIDRNYFLDIGAYDDGLLVWGGENFELSFKVWQCGGRILWVPCSRVGHVYRSFMPYTFGSLAKNKKGPLITINYKRVIETWFDEKYKEFFYTREPLARYLNMGDISKQLAMKERLQCKSFQWFMEEVAPDLLTKFPELPPNVHWGELRNLATLKCLDTLGHGPPARMSVSECHGFGNNQLVRLNSQGQLGIGERCIDGGKQGIRLVFCRLGSVDGPWQYDEKGRTLLHVKMQMCLALHPQTSQLSLMPCDYNNSFHQWIFKEIHPKW